MGVWDTFGKLHTAVYRLSGGHVGARLGGQQMLILTTRGRRSGRERSVALAYVTDGDDLVVVASNGGADVHPAWWLNLQAQPEAMVEVGTTRRRVVARPADATTRTRLWPRLKAGNAFYARYEQRTKREIPVVLLRPA